MARNDERRPADLSDALRAEHKANPRALGRRLALLYINERNALFRYYRPGWMRKEARRGKK